MDAKIKLQIIKSVTALLCAGCLCASTIISANKLAETYTANDVATVDTTVSQENGYVENSDEVVAEDVTDAVATDDVSADTETADTAEADSTDTTVAAADTSSNKTVSTKTTAKSTSSVPSTKAEIISYCSTALNNAKKAKPGYKKVYTRVCNGDLPSLVLKIIKQNKTTTMSKGDDNTEDFPVGGYSWACKLRESDVTSATCKQNGQYYEITLKLGKEVNPGKGEASAYGRAVTVITQDDAKAMLSGIKTVSLTYHDGYVYAKIDSKTGKLVKAEFSATADISADISVLGKLSADNIKSTETFTDFVW